MRSTAMTQKDKDFMKLGKQVHEVIKTPKEWREFKQYCDFYYKKHMNMEEYLAKQSKKKKQ